MKNSEKILIQNLFDRLRSMEKTASDKDKEAWKFIESLLDHQKNSIYYMVQTILIQETIIHDLKNKINFLEKQVANYSQSSFLSPSLQKQVLNDDHCSSVKNSKNIQDDTNYNIQNKRTISSFLGNALQTAAGVAGGIFAGNILTNLFSYPQENSSVDTIDNIHHNQSDHENSQHFSENHVVNQDESFDYDTDQNSVEYIDYYDDDYDSIDN
ncbi:DUF2076 domain-containing protein [Buchnera aphidicola]|uniref:DUF2076 domain-containing protein n=1 Tax=Buchnera aphidicola TaxID=9 RepID=UPI003463FC4A